MLEYLLKSGACMAIFMLFYKFLLERENMHMFKRFYLLGALVASLIIPNLVFVEYVEPMPIVDTFNPMIGGTSPEIISSDGQSNSNEINVPMLLLVVYCIGALVFGIRFLTNLFDIVVRIRQNPKIKENRIIKVLLGQEVPPHTFFSYIFLNKEKFEADQIPRVVLLHEETHAKQKHSYDILFVELMQVFLWFNPLVYLFKKSIKLNHEFLADSAVLKKEISTETYQNTLLSFMSAEKNQSVTMANAINYSSIKKRFTVMKKQASKKSVLLRSTLLLPLIAIILFGFSQKKVLQSPPESASISECAGIKHLTIVLSENELQMGDKKFSGSIDWLTYLVKNYGEGPENKDLPKLHFNLINKNNEAHDIGGLLFAFSNGLWKIHEASVKTLSSVDSLETKEGATKYKQDPVEQQSATPAEMEEYRRFIAEYEKTKIINYQKYTRAVAIYKLMNESQKKSVKKYPKIPETNLSKRNTTPPTSDDLEAFKDKNKFAVWLDGKVIENEILERYEPSDFVHFFNSYVYNNARSQQFPQEYQVHLYTAAGFKKAFEKKGATDTELSQYNILAKRYNAIPIKARTIPLGKLRMLESIYRKMSKTQKENAEPFPECLPKNQQKGATQKQIAEYNALAKKYYELPLGTGISSKDIERINYIYGIMSDKQKANAESYPFPDFPEPPPPPKAPKTPKNISDRQYASNQIDSIINTQDPYDNTNVMAIDLPPPPSTPISPLDHVVEMAKKGATFYYGNKKITSDRAIEILKANDDLSISTKQINGEPPVVRISKSL